MDRNDLRIGDAEREHTMAALREHFAQGRLTHEELDERLDKTLAAKTARDLGQVTADLPGQGQAPVYDAPDRPHQWDRDAWREAMTAQRQQMRSMRDAHREQMHSMRGARGHRGDPWRRHRGPHPLVPMLFVLMVLGLIFGGFGIFKVLLAVWLGSMLFSMVRRRFHYRD
ncbi:DUF1707 domain-containing protein [Nonomuraea sp. NPDC046802]|uniref:DUF1707 SHOCT-like domain-containing protein n=1 Tax=Nonomuraea sp. NPDC046802 TaxID=3154919 RepID=UPI0033D74FE6